MSFQGAALIVILFKHLIVSLRTKNGKSTFQIYISQMNWRFYIIITPQWGNMVIKH